MHINKAGIKGKHKTIPNEQTLQSIGWKGLSGEWKRKGEEKRKREEADWKESDKQENKCSSVISGT